MNKRRFVRERQQAWRRFERLIPRLDAKGSRKLSAAEVAEFSRLFRELSNDLAIVRSRDWGAGLASYLNDLVARGHNAFYSAPVGDAAGVVHYLAVGFPRLFRANFGYFVVAALLFFGPFGVSWAVVQNDTSLASRVVSNETLELYESMYADGEDEDRGGFGEERALMAGFYVRNNVGIALQCFAHGILLGLGTVWTLLYNGIYIGTVAGYIVGQGASERFLSFVVSHGSFELTAIAVSGGAGLMLADAVLHPGRRRRLDALRVRGLEALQIATGAAVMLIVAALIEAFWSPAPVPATWKYGVGAVLWVLVFLYLGLAGRGR